MPSSEYFFIKLTAENIVVDNMGMIGV